MYVIQFLPSRIHRIHVYRITYTQHIPHPPQESTNEATALEKAAAG